MERKRNEAGRNRGFYIAVGCCVAVIAIVGYVSWFAGNSRVEAPKGTELSEEEFIKAPNLSEAVRVPLSEEKKEPERATVPVENVNIPAAKNVISEDNTPDFEKPVKGEVICEFSGDKLVFCNPLSDWGTHDGVDFKAQEGEEVLASADGVVESVYADSMGNCVVIDHENGLKTLYANLAEADAGLTGKNVAKGDKIGAVGNSALADFSEEAHLHFEILKDDAPQNPTEYLK